MADPKWNVSGGLVDQKDIFQNIGGALTYYCKAIQNIAGSRTTIWQKAVTSWWESVGFTASILSQSKVEHKYGSGSITNVAINGNTVTFTVQLTSTSKDLAYTYAPYGPYGAKFEYYNYKFGNFTILLPKSVSFENINTFTMSSENRATTIYVSDGETKSGSYICRSLEYSYGYSNASVGFSYTSDNNTTSSMYSYSQHNQNTMSLTYTVNWSGRSAALTKSCSLISSAMSSSCPFTATADLMTNPNATSVTATYYHFVGTLPFAIDARCRISIGAGVSYHTTDFSATGTISLLDSAGNVLKTITKSDKGFVQWSSLWTAISVSQGTYQMKYDFWSTSLPVPTATEIL